MPLLNDIVLLTPEQHLLLSSLQLCLKAEFASPSQGVQDDVALIDWAAFWREVNLNDVQPLIFHAIQHGQIQCLPPHKMHIKAMRQAIAIQNAHLTQTLLSILQTLESNGINVIPFKGPILSLRVYKNLTQRRFCDLDLLVDQADFEPTKRLFINAGYDLNIDEAWSAHLIHPKTNINIDLHHQITESYFPTQLNFQHLLQRSQSYQYAGHSIQVLSPEDTFILLCIQLAKDAHHQQKFLKKAYDLALFIERIDFKWQEAIAYARAMNSKRLVLFSVYIVSQLLGVEVPNWLDQDIENDRILSAYGQSVCQRLFTENTFQRGSKGMLLRTLFLLENPFEFNHHKRDFFQHILTMTAAKVRPLK